MTSSQSAAEVAALLNAYLIGLDDDFIDAGWAKGLFTDDVVIAFPPNARQEGIDGVPEFHRTSLKKFARHQHMGSPAVVEVDGDRAALRANVIATHVLHRPADAPQDAAAPVFQAGTFVKGEARRTPQGWRLSALSFEVVWTNGTAPATH
ncbi:nuclear transport factor 2 family protein [Streptomyces sp. NPDC051211]|uniref:nuclear transport factor 2 family protein n=1 Tax=Streptomyces sp. NPDC051211 TaxID=3154643 RepID=UPI00344C6FC3